MNYLEKNNSKIFSTFVWILFGLLMIYLLLRAFFLEPLHDEAATFFYYIESGIYWGPDMMLDANNHLLNSVLGHWVYLVFGDQLFFIRLPNVIAFVFYFWGIYRFIKPISSNLQKTLILLGTTCIPFVLEYFANTRGYGLSLGLFVFSLSYIRDFVVNHNIKSAYWSSLLMCLTVYANLTFLLTLILMAALFILIQWTNKQKISTKQHLLLFLSYILLAISMLPNLYYAHILKESGALYYGSLDGFWEVTGKTLSRYILFHDLNWLKYAFIIVFSLLAFHLIRRWKKLGYFKFFSESATILAWFLFGNCLAIILMAVILKINYPEDRVGMHLAVLFILLLGFLLTEIKRLNWLLFAMLFFPFTMIPRMNLTTSVFSPDDRISKPYFQKVVQNLNPYSTVSIYPLQLLTWSYLSRDLEANNFVTAERDFNLTSDIVMTKTTLFKEEAFLKNYKVIAYNPESTHIAYQRKSPYTKEVIFSAPINIIDSQDEYITIFQSEIPDSLRNRRIQFHVDADVTAENIFREFAIITYSTFDKEMTLVDYHHINQRWVHGVKKEFPLNFNYAVEELKPTENEIRIYIWNRKNEKISLKNGVFQMLELTDASDK